MSRFSRGTTQIVGLTPRTAARIKQAVAEEPPANLPRRATYLPTQPQWQAVLVEAVNPGLDNGVGWVMSYDGDVWTKQGPCNIIEANHLPLMLHTFYPALPVGDSVDYVAFTPASVPSMDCGGQPPPIELAPGQQLFCWDNGYLWIGTVVGNFAIACGGCPVEVPQGSGSGTGSSGGGTDCPVLLADVFATTNIPLPLCGGYWLLPGSSPDGDTFSFSATFSGVTAAYGEPMALSEDGGVTDAVNLNGGSFQLTAAQACTYASIYLHNWPVDILDIAFQFELEYDGDGNAWLLKVWVFDGDEPDHLDAQYSAASWDYDANAVNTLAYTGNTSGSIAQQYHWPATVQITSNGGLDYATQVVLNNPLNLHTMDTGGSWTIVTGDLGTVNGKAFASVVPAIAVADAFQSDNVTVTVIVSGPGGGLVLCESITPVNGPPNYYLFDAYTDSNGDSWLQYQKVVAGIVDYLTTTALTAAWPCLLEASKDGGSLVFSANGSILAINDPSPLTGTKFGISATNTACQFKSFELVGCIEGPTGGGSGSGSSGSSWWCNPLAYLCDTFTDAASFVLLTAHAMDIGPGWSLLDPSAPDWSVTGGQAVPSLGGPAIVSDAGAGHSDFQATVDIGFDGGSDEVGLVACVGRENGNYAFYTIVFEFNNISIIKFVPRLLPRGTYDVTTIASSSSASLPAGTYTLTASSQGGAMTASVGAYTISGTDATPLTGTSYGMIGAALWFDNFEVVPVVPAAASVTAVSPDYGAKSGGTTVTIAGTAFTGATAVYFAGVAASSFTVDSATQITAVTGVWTSGTSAVPVTVVTPAGTSNDTIDFEYLGPPTVSAISPTDGPTGGGTSVTITGTFFETLWSENVVTGVSFGSTPASYTVNSETSITAVSPAGSAGTVDVRVTNVDGESATSSGDEFTYFAAPTVAGVSPSSGTTFGGTSVTITGTNFTGATAVTFGSTGGTSITVVSATEITVTSPAESAGTVNVTVATPGGTSATSGADDYTFVTPTLDTPTFSPGAGSYGPSQTVTISSNGIGEAIYWNTVGSPTSGSTLYTGPITVSTTETVYAIAELAGWSNSAVGSAAYTINGDAATPAFSPAAGTYSSTQTVTITSTSGSTIWYTTDGSTPSVGGGGTTSSISSGSTISVAASETVKAIASLAGYSNSAEGDAAYTISAAANALAFAAASTQYVSVPTSSTLNASGDFTACCWFKTSTMAGQILFAKDSPGQFQTGYWLYIAGSSNLIEFGCALNGTTGNYLDVTGVNYADGSRHFLCMVRSGSTLTLYMDGSSVGSITLAAGTADCSTTNPFRMGYWNANSLPYNGDIEDMQFYHGAALSSGNVSTLNSNGPNVPLPGSSPFTSISARWRFTEGSGSTATDEVNGNAGTLTNGPTWISPF